MQTDFNCAISSMEMVLYTYKEVFGGRGQSTWWPGPCGPVEVGRRESRTPLVFSQSAERRDLAH